MKIEQVAAQLYTLRDHIKTPPDIAATLKRVRDIGYQAVQVSAMGPIEESELAKILDGEGLVCCVTHEPADTFLNEPQKVVERLSKLGVKHTAYPHPRGVNLASEEEVKALAKKLNESGKIFKDAAQQLSYHNHAVEFTHAGGKPALEIIYDETDPELLMSELDTYWVQAGGASPVDWCIKLKNRLPLLHLKDFGVFGDNKGVMCEIGRGNIDWKKLIAAAQDSGCEWFIVEQDSNWINNDPFESLEVSFNYIKDNLCS